MTLVKFNNGLQKRANHPFFDGLFNDEFLRPFFGDRAVACVNPAANVLESADTFYLEIAAPGISKEDFKISIEKDVLKVQVAKEQTADENQPSFRRREFNFSSFERSFKLPKSVNQEGIEARYEQGVLTVKLPKLVEAQEKPTREIVIE